MRYVRFIPDDRGEETLRRLARGDAAPRVPELWNVLGALELDVGLSEPLRLTCGNPVRHALEPLCELSNWASGGRTNLLSVVMGTAGLNRSSHLYHRWHGAYEAVLLLGERDSTIGVNREADRLIITVLETDDQSLLEDQSASLERGEVVALPAMLWDDLDGLLKLVGVELEARERTRWERLRPLVVA
jgi:hypothetical protein